MELKIKGLSGEHYKIYSFLAAVKFRQEGNSVWVS